MNTPGLRPALSTVLLLWIVVGCSENRVSEIEVTYNCAANATDILQLQAELPSFTDTTGVHVTLQPFTGQEKLYAMMAAGQAPDIFYTNTVVRDRLAAENRILDLRGVALGDPFLHRISPDVLEGGMAADSGLYSIGNWVFTAGVYYNRDLFDAAGLSYPDSSWTWQEMRTVARRLTRDINRDGTIDTYGIFIGSHFVELIEQMNSDRPLGNELLLHLPRESIEAYREYVSLMTDGLMPDLRRIQAMGMQPVQLLQTGKVAMLVEAVPHQTLFETLTVRWGIAPIPKFPGKPVRYFRSGSGGLSISSQSGHPDAAWRTLKWIIAGAAVYQPNPVLRDVDFVGGCERRYPSLTGSGFREVWEWSIRYNAGDPRFFVRFSSWTSATILERLQPMLDRVWSREMRPADLPAEVPAINAAAKKELLRVEQRTDLNEGFLREIRKEIMRLE